MADENKFWKMLFDLVSSDDGLLSVFKSGLVSTGIGGLAFFVLWLVVKNVLDLDIFTQMGATYTFVVIILLLVLMSVITYVSIWTWHKQKLKELELKKPSEKPTTIAFTLPQDGGTFGSVADQLARIGNVFLNDENFDEEAKMVNLVGGRPVKAESVKQAIELLSKLVKEGEQLPSYEVSDEGGELLIRRRRE